MSAGVGKPWMCEIRADIRASGAGEVASTFHETKTNFPALLELYPVLVHLDVGSKETHLLTDESNLYHGWKIGVASASPAGKGTSYHHRRVWFRSRENMLILLFSCFAICLESERGREGEGETRERSVEDMGMIRTSGDCLLILEPLR